VRGFVANTDFDWYQFLRARPELREVNFWRPSQARFGALHSGELFFFKLKAPHNAIGGFGLFTRAVVLPVWEAWDVFELANGVTDRDSLLARLGRLSHGAGKGITIDDWIGCLAIAEPVFFPPDSWVPVPSDWSRSIVSGKGYDLTTGEGRRLYEACLEAAAVSDQEAEWSVEALSATRRGKPLEVRPRLGQATFRIAVLDAYSRRCAITGERSLPVVEASHIRPFSHGGPHAVPNGLPLRRDIHRLFDLGYVSVRPDRSFAVSQALRDEYENGRVYYEMDGKRLRDPAHQGDRADPTLLEWHYEEVFRQS
jgi:putative restriction endonuclease